MINVLRSVVIGIPTGLLVVQTSATSVIVEWSQPSGGATVTGYVVHYIYGATNMSQSVPSSSTHVEIPNLIECYNYTFSVEATSERLFGISKEVIVELGIDTFFVLMMF